MEKSVQPDIRYYINLDSLYVMQSDLRYADHRVLDMIEHVKNKGFWSFEALMEWGQKHGCHQTSPILITRFEDDKLFLHDGNHRGVSTYIGGRTYLCKSEYNVMDMKYSQYQEINFVTNFLTPFDPRTEARLPEIRVFKKEVMAIAAKDKEAAKKFVLANKARYCIPQKLMTVPEFAAKVLKTIFSGG